MIIEKKLEIGDFVYFETLKGSSVGKIVDIAGMDVRVENRNGGQLTMPTTQCTVIDRDEYSFRAAHLLSKKTGIYIQPTG